MSDFCASDIYILYASDPSRRSVNLGMSGRGKGRCCGCIRINIDTDEEVQLGIGRSLKLKIIARRLHYSAPAFRNIIEKVGPHFEDLRRIPSWMAGEIIQLTFSLLGID